MRRLALAGLLLSACSDDSSGESTTTTGPTSAPTCPATQDCTAPGDTTAAPTTAPGATSTGGPTADPTTGASDPGTSTGVDPTTASTGGETASDPGTTTGGLDCAADCESCWACAKQGACKAPYEACMLETFCVPTLFCLETMCTPDGLPQGCADTCCMSCTNLGTCQGVNAAADCIEQQCAGLCQAPTCG